MKRLVDSTDSELMRSLLQSGVEDAPPANGKAKLLTALGVGAGVSLAPAKALAWWSGAGAKTAITVGVVAAVSAGGYYFAGGNAEFTGDAAPRTVSQHGVSVVVSEPPHSENTPPTRATATAPSGPAGAIAPSTKPVPSSGDVASRPVDAATTRESPASASPNVASPPERGRPARGRAQARTNHSKLDRGRARSEQRGTPLRSERPPTPGTPQPNVSTATLHSLQREIELVDRIRIAASQSPEAFDALLRQYVEKYPQGQFLPELERLEAAQPTLAR